LTRDDILKRDANPEKDPLIYHTFQPPDKYIQNKWAGNDRILLNKERKKSHDLMKVFFDISELNEGLSF